MQSLEYLVSLGYIRLSPSNEYQLKRPVKIVVKNNVIEALKKVYQKNYEQGGVMELRPLTKGVLICDNFIFVKNTSVNSYSYAPNMALLNSKVFEVTDRGNLPVVIHTHPTEIGIHAYDRKRVQFFLKSSRPDRVISRNTNEVLNMPEAIFVKDTRFGNQQYALNFFTGGIFPQSVSALSTNQIIALSIAAIGMLFNKISRKILVLLAGLFFFEFYRRPDYTYLPNGDLEVKLTF